MRLTLAFILSTLILATAWQDALLYLIFKTHQKTLAKTVCQNKDKPELECKAACYFKAELKQEHEKKQDPSTPTSPTPKEKTPFQKSETNKPLSRALAAKAVKASVTANIGDLSPPFVSPPFKPPA